MANIASRIKMKWHISDIGTGLGPGPEFRPIAISTMQNSARLDSVFIIQPVYHKNIRKNGLNNRHGDFCDSGISACPESVGVGKFCWLRLRLRLREKQPTPTDSDSDSDSAALATILLSLIFEFRKHWKFWYFFTIFYFCKKNPSNCPILQKSEYVLE